MSAKDLDGVFFSSEGAWVFTFLFCIGSSTLHPASSPTATSPCFLLSPADGGALLPRPSLFSNAGAGTIGDHSGPLVQAAFASGVEDGEGVPETDENSSRMSSASRLGTGGESMVSEKRS